MSVFWYFIGQVMNWVTGRLIYIENDCFNKHMRIPQLFYVVQDTVQHPTATN